MGGKSSKKLTKEDLTFLLNNTSFTKPQIKQWYKGFMVKLFNFYLYFHILFKNYWFFKILSAINF